MRLLMITLLVMGMSILGVTFGQTSEGDCYTNSLEVFTFSLVDENSEANSALYTYDEQRGCCSWHGGVCGCSGGRKECCDGTLSPTCTCHHDDNLEGYYQ